MKFIHLIFPIMIALLVGGCGPLNSEGRYLNMINKTVATEVVRFGESQYTVSYIPVGSANSDQGYFVPDGKPVSVIMDGGWPMVTVVRNDEPQLSPHDEKLAHQIAIKACEENLGWSQEAFVGPYSYDLSELSNVALSYFKDDIWTFVGICE